MSFDFAIYYAPEPTSDPEAILEQLLAGEFPSHDQLLTMEKRWEDVADWPPPNADALRYTSVDVTGEQHKAILNSTRVFVLTFESQGERLLGANRLAAVLVERIARITGGFPWDDECRLLYSADSWKSRRIENWKNNFPDVRGHVNMHAYRNPELVRVITLGMRKFGLPDLIVEEIPSGNTRAAGNLINSVAQYLIEGGALEGQRLKFNFDQLQNDDMRASAMADPGPDATGTVLLRVESAVAEDGDPNNILWSLSFPDFEGKSPTERALTAFASTFGATDEIVQHPSGDSAMEEASERARKLFFEREAYFRRGLQPNERLLVKKGFKVPGGTEYMWVEVTKWTGDAVEGTLANDPYYDKTLREGVRVTVKLDEVFDFIHFLPDGTDEGNETGKVLRQKQVN